ncbi:hypothetical protein ABEB36_007057 [Hypothenemus hampei]|uniref:Regulator of G-protein signaling loco n=1 Tax=Hypothenemus hampei TaxID=57062 RepID=A0ABD1ESM1_HYPHA
MHPNRRRKKRPNYGLRTVEISRGSNGFGFTISGQQPCILSCIVNNSPADQAGLRAGDFLISVNGISVSKMAHDAVVGLIANCVEPIKMTIAENYYSDSSDEELDLGERKPKYSHKPRHYRRPHKGVAVEPNQKHIAKFRTSPTKPSCSTVDNEAVSEEGPIEYKALVGYLGTIEMPKQLLPNSRLQTVCSCIRKLRQEKRPPTTVLMTVLPTCLTLKNALNHILAIYPSNRVVYTGCSPEKDTRYFGLVTSAVHENAKECLEQVDISNSCHIFVIDPKLVNHQRHLYKAESFNISCTPDAVTGCCLEFPRDALYLVNFIQTMYKLQTENELTKRNANNQDVMANSPQPSASSNSDSGIGYRDDCGPVSDRILVVEFPTCRPPPNERLNTNNNRPHGIDGSNLSLLNNNKLSVNSSTKILGNVRTLENHFDNYLLKHNNVDSCKMYRECPIDVPESNEHTFRIPKFRKKLKGDANMNRKVNFSCEELNTRILYEDKICFGSLQNLNGPEEKKKTKKELACQSEPDVRICRNLSAGDRKHEGDRLSGDTPTEYGATSWATSFEKLLEDPFGLHAFTEFLKKEFSAENIYFWIACERYRRLPTAGERSIQAQNIVAHHIGIGAPESVNVDAQGVLTAEQGLAEAGPNIFDNAQKQIFNLMKFDSYPRFLKSHLYKQCLNGDFYVPSFDPRLSIDKSSGPLLTPKLKKSLSNAEDRRRKSLLPWHRKTGTSHKQSDTQKSWDGVLTVPQEDTGTGTLQKHHHLTACGVDLHSSHSSLTSSLDLALSQDCTTEPRTSLCRILLANGSTTVVQIKNDETVQQLIKRLLEKRGLNYSSYEVFTNKHAKALDLNESASILAGCEATVEQRVVFKLDLPNKKIIAVKSKYTKLIVDVLRPILHKYKFSLEQVTVTRAGYFVDITLPVTTIDNARLYVQLKDERTETDHVSNKNIKISKLEEITNKVFEGILQEKSEGATFIKSDKGSVKSEDWGSEHSSGLLGKFLRRDSAVHGEKKKKNGCQRAKLPNEFKEDQSIQQECHYTSKKPLIAKLKAGANKLHVGTYSESDELVEGLTRAQRRLEDQRGTEINFELPDFLKDNSDTATKKSTIHQYENQNVVASPVRNVEMLTPSKPSPLKKPVLVGEGASPKMEPPPLPPKPKIVPIKPLNWGQSGFYKAKEVHLEKHSKDSMFVEQPSGSFV